MAEIPDSAMLFMSGLSERARKLKKTIVLPEGDDPRVLDAAARLARDGVVRPVLIGPKPANAPAGVEFIDPATNARLAEKYAAFYHERRRAKGITHMEAAVVAEKPPYFPSLIGGAGGADGHLRRPGSLHPQTLPRPPRP